MSLTHRAVRPKTSRAMLTIRRAGAAWMAIAAVVAAFVFESRDALAQQPASRAEEIENARRQKQAMLWPEREDPMVARANNLLNRGFGEGLQTGTGANGWQLLFAGTRAGQGQAFGVGYRRSDLLHDTLSARAAVRGTLAGAVVVDGEAELNGLRHSADTFVTLSAKYERSPRME